MVGADPAARKRYVEAFQRSDFEAMLNYYKRNYPSGRRRCAAATELPKVKMPVLMFHVAGGGGRGGGAPLTRLGGGGVDIRLRQPCRPCRTRASAPD